MHNLFGFHQNLHNLAVAGSATIPKTQNDPVAVLPRLPTYRRYPLCLPNHFRTALKMVSTLEEKKGHR